MGVLGRQPAYANSRESRIDKPATGAGFRVAERAAARTARRSMAAEPMAASAALDADELAFAVAYFGEFPDGAFLGAQQALQFEHPAPFAQSSRAAATHWACVVCDKSNGRPRLPAHAPENWYGP